VSSSPPSRDAQPPSSADPRGQGDPVTPDRKRIDSDVRCFLRQPSTPWIVFDKDGRPSQVAPEELARARGPYASIVADYALPADPLVAVAPAAPLFPSSPPVAAGQPSVVEPSSVAVAADVGAVRETSPDPFPGTLSEEIDIDPSILGTPVRRLARRVTWAAGALVAAAAFAGIVLSATSGSRVEPASSGAPAAAAAAPAPTAADRDGLGTASVAPPSPSVPTAAVAPAPAPAGPRPTATVEERPAAKKFGRLTIGGSARSKNVFLDGKRLLGSGARTFTVFCGTHDISVGERNDGREMDVPCNGELVVSH